MFHYYTCGAQGPTFANEEARKRNRIAEVQAFGAFTRLELKNTVPNLKPQAEPKRRPYHQHAPAQQIVSREPSGENWRSEKVVKDGRKYFEKRARVAERENMAEERRGVLLPKFIAKEVVKFWKLAVTVVKERKKEQERQEQVRRGKQHLDAFLHQSNQVLEMQNLNLRAAALAREMRSSFNSSSSSFTSDVNQDERSARDDRAEGVHESDEEAARLLELPEDDDMDAGHPAQGITLLLAPSSFEPIVHHSMGLTEPTKPREPLSNVSEVPSTPSPSNSDRDFDFIATQDSVVDLEEGQSDQELDMEIAEEDFDEAEIDGLEQDASLPIEALLRRYGDVAVPEDPEFDVGDVSTLYASDRLLDIEMEIEEENFGDGDSDEELNGLEAEADVPIEELLKRYGYTHRSRDGFHQAEDMGTRDKLDGTKSVVTAGLHLSDFSLLDTGSSTIHRAGRVERSSAFGQSEAEEEIRSNVVDTWSKLTDVNSYNRADEMGLGKTAQTIALLGYLACSKGIWGPHLIIVPTSVLLNWEMEFKRFLPGFNTLSYYRTQKERKEKRRGWINPYAFNVCITSYQLALADHATFRRKKWVYMILDEAHNIKNFKSKR
ncbi:hypothetical protein FRB90_002371 [Tulasnella sp. 427]|nr:hypothetical protein FRB90_002371 [Tulasnella sp. 427]